MSAVQHQLQFEALVAELMLVLNYDTCPAPPPPPSAEPRDEPKPDKKPDDKEKVPAEKPEEKPKEEKPENDEGPVKKKMKTSVNDSMYSEPVELTLALEEVLKQYEEEEEMQRIAAGAY